jgi:hypothetical protein
MFLCTPDKTENMSRGRKEFLITYVVHVELGTATGYGLDGPGSIPSAATFSVLHSVQTDSGAHPVTYPMGTRDAPLPHVS